MELTKNIKKGLFAAGIIGIFAALWRFYQVQKKLIIDATTYRIVGILPTIVSLDNVVLKTDIEMTNNSDISIHLTSVNLTAQASFDGGNSQKIIANINAVQDQIIPARGSFVLKDMDIQFNPRTVLTDAAFGAVDVLFNKNPIKIYITGNVYFKTDFLNIKADVPVDMKYEFKI